MSGREIPKIYDASKVEDGLYDAWLASGFFNPDNLPGDRPEAFSIVLPPPNVTGTLHIGHAAMLAIEDAMIRFARLRGKKALWIPGVDHAAIATQARVEKKLIKDGLKHPRHELGREKFLEEVCAFAAASHDTIVGQMRKMGCSLDWSREAYTLDAKRSAIVRTVFKKMYDDGLIYRGDRVVNWCPRCQSTLADDEVEHRERVAKLYTFRYDKNFPVAISTTRPETKLGDTAVAVHPDDTRYASFVGQTLTASLAGQSLSLCVVADSSVDPTFGTGALGVTPAHSQTDADLAFRHELSSRHIIGEDGRMTAEAGAFAGKSVEEARADVLDWLHGEGLLEKEEEVSQNLSVCYRCASPIEPLPKLQWFIDVNKQFTFRASAHAPINGLASGQKVTLKSVMQHVVRSGQIKILPERFEGTYFHWIDNLRDWCISRQIWFCHRVPVWYRDDVIVVGEKPDGNGWTQDPDTLDTWFSAGLWTISTLDNPSDFERYHPTSVLETGYDIIFQWVARMILMTTYMVGEVPFRTVYLHGLVRDEEGRKMSKSLDNVIDPLDMITAYGADATRLSLVVGSTPGNDMKLSAEKIAGYRNFTNKLWNIARFIIGGVEGIKVVEEVEVKTLADEWILARLDQTIASVTKKLEAYQLSSAAEELRDFTWSDFADWYLEIAKVEGGKDNTLLFILERLLVLWHPFAPFVTEEIWKSFGTGTLLIVHEWPSFVPAHVGASDGKPVSFELLREVITTIRNVRSESKVEPKVLVDVSVVGPAAQVVLENLDVVKRLARVENIASGEQLDRPDSALHRVVGTSDLFVVLPLGMDVEDEARRAKELEEAETYLASLEAKLADKEFLAKAPAKVIESMRAKETETRQRIQKLSS